MKYVVFALSASAFLRTCAMPSPAYSQQPVQIVGPLDLTTNQVLIGTGPTLVVPSRTRYRLGINVLAANNCAFGNSAVSLTTGYRLQPTAGAAVTIESSAAVYGICDVATTASYMETK